MREKGIGKGEEKEGMRMSSSSIDWTRSSSLERLMRTLACFIWMNSSGTPLERSFLISFSMNFFWGGRGRDEFWEFFNLRIN